MNDAASLRTTLGLCAGVALEFLPPETDARLLHEAVEKGLKKFNNPKLSRIQIGDIKFHVSMYVAARIVNKLKPYTKDISGIDLALLTDELIAEAIEHVFLVYDMMGGNNSVAKGREFVKEALEQVENNLQKNERTT